MVEDLWDDEGFEEPSFPPVSKQNKSNLGTVQTVPCAQAQDPIAACHAKTSDLQHLRELHLAVEEAEAELEACVEALSLLTLRAGKSEQLVASMQTELAQLQQDQQKLLTDKPLPIGRVKMLEGSIAELAAAMEQQTRQLSQTQQSIRRAELDVRAAEDGVLDCAQTRLEMQGLASRLAAQEQQSAATRQEQELRGALARSKQLKRQQQQQAEAVATAEESKHAAVTAATAGQKAAAARMKQKLTQLSPMKEAVDSLHRQIREKQQRAAVDLKHHIDAAQAELADKAEIHQTRARQQNEMHAKEFDSLLQSGQNPYAVFRQQSEAAKIAVHQRRQAGKVKAKEGVITSQLEAEEQAHQRAVAARKAVQQVEAQFAKEMGAEARERRIDRFMKSHTVGHQSILDPTGNLPVYPSEAVQVKNWSFGMGTGSASAELIAKYQQLNPEVQPNDILIPRKLRQLEPLSGTASAAVSPTKGATAETVPNLPTALVGLDASGDQEPEGPYKPKLSKHEQQLMQQAHQRHQDNITTKQVVMGREFHGEAFKPNPAIALFKDFEVGQSYSQVITLTNVSLARNTFKVLELPAEICDIVEVQYKPPGRLSAGLTCQLTVLFTPKANDDIESSIPLLSETGPIAIPLSCLIKRAVISVQPQEVSVGPNGGVVLGEQGHASFTILNEGALEVQYSISAHEPQSLPALPAGTSLPKPAGGDPEDTQQLEMGSLVVLSRQGTVKGYSRAMVKMSFTPPAAGHVRQQIRIHFRAIRDKKLALPDHLVTLTGLGRPVPVYMDTSLIDFKCCFMGQVYRDAVRIHNRGSAAMKATLSLPHAVQPFLQAQPIAGFCQSEDSFEFALRLCGHANIWRECGKYVIDKEAGILQFPAKVTVVGQVLPVQMSIRIQLTSTHISFRPRSIEFGQCNLGENTGVSVQMTNHSLLPQKYGFASLPKGVSISPGDGFGTLLPLETLPLTFAFMPPLKGPYTFQLECRTPLTTHFSLPCTAMVVLPAITLSHTCVKLPATAIHDVSTTSITLQNTTAEAQTFEFSVPQASDLTLSPHVATIPAEGSLSVALRYSPQPSPPSEGSLQSAASTTGAEAASGMASDDVEERGSKDEAAHTSWPRCHKWHIPCHIKPHAHPPLPPSPTTPAQSSSRQSPRSSRQTHGQSHSHRLSTSEQQQQPETHVRDDRHGLEELPAAQVIHLDVSTCAVLPVLSVQGEGTSWRPEPGVWELDFGSSAVGQRVVKQLVVTNSATQVLPLSTDLLSPEGTFSLVNAVRPLQAQGTSTVSVAFLPQECKVFEEVLSVQCPNSRLRIRLKGAGIAPAIKVTPEDVVTKGMHMGDVLRGDNVERAVTITNTGTFTTSYRVAVQPSSDSAHPTPYARQAPFTCSPQEGSLAPGASQKVAVAFSPEQAFPYYQASLHLTVPGMQDICWDIQGRAWEEGGTIVGPEYTTSLADPFSSTASASTTAVDTTEDLQLTMRMPKAVAPGESVSVTVDVVSIKSKAGGSPVELTVDPIPASAAAAGLKIDNMKVSVPAGERKPVTVTYTAPQLKPGSMADMGLSETVVRTITGTLKGGVPPPKAAAGRRIYLNIHSTLCRSV